jgi:hypothetical protein
MTESTMIIKKYGNKYWYLDGKLHREDGPAIECVNESKYWYQNDVLHREDGPAIEYTDGYTDCTKLWYLNGKQITEEEFITRTNDKLLKETVREFFRMLDTVEESDSGREFHPITISCCRTVMIEPMNNILKRMKELCNG